MFVDLRTDFCDKYEKQKKYDLVTCYSYTHLVHDLPQPSAND